MKSMSGRQLKDKAVPNDAVTMSKRNAQGTSETRNMDSAV